MIPKETSSRVTQAQIDANRGYTSAQEAAYYGPGGPGNTNNPVASATDGLIAALTAAYSSSLSSSGADHYATDLSNQIAQQQLDMQKSQWQDQLAQYQQTYGFNSQVQQQTNALQWAQLNGSQEQFQKTLDLQTQSAQHSWDQFLQTFNQQGSQFTASQAQQQSQFSASLADNQQARKDSLGFQLTSLTANLKDAQKARDDAAKQQALGLASNEKISAAGNATQLATANISAGASKYATDAQAAASAASTAVTLQLGLGNLAVSQGQLALNQKQEAFNETDVNTQRLLEAAGLATSPAGAIQLAYMARGAGAPAGAIAAMFQNLPFIQAALHGQILPGFTGIPEQLGGGTVGSGGSNPVAAAMPGGTSSTESLSASPVQQAVASGNPQLAGAPASSVTKATAQSNLVSTMAQASGAPSSPRATTAFNHKGADGKWYATSAIAAQAVKPVAAPETSAAGATMAASVGPQQGTSTPKTGAGTSDPSGTTIDFSRGLGVKMPDLTSMTERQFNGMSDQEKVFMGALYQSENGIPAAAALQQIQKSFIPTVSANQASL
jgi:hypothetical protein